MKAALKTAFKKVRFFDRANQLLKARSTKATYNAIVQHYSSLPDQGRAELRSHAGKHPAVLLLGTDYAQDSSGMLQALARHSRLTPFKRRDGTYGLVPSASLTSLNAFKDNADRILEVAETMAAAGNPPQVVIGQMWGVAFDPEVLSELRKRFGTVAVNICMDDRHTFWGGRNVEKRRLGTIGVVPYVDLVATATPEAVDWYRKEGRPAVFFPQASDPDIFHPMPDCPKVHDVCFVGARYGIRERIVLTLRRAGVAVAALGQGWEGGRAPVDEVPRLFAQSKIVLGIGTIGHCTDFFALKLRDFDAPMSGTFYLTHDNPDLRLVYDIGREIETYRSVDDCVDKVRHYLCHDIEREAIARAGWARARRDHTWGRRSERLFDLLSGKIPCAEFTAW